MTDNEFSAFVLTWKTDHKGPEMVLRAGSINMGLEEAERSFVDLLLVRYTLALIGVIRTYVKLVQFCENTLF